MHGFVELVPMRPAKVETMRSIRDASIWQSANIGDHAVEDPDDPAVDVGMCRARGLNRIKQHNVTLRGVNVYDVLFVSSIVGGILDSHQFVTEYPVSLEYDIRPVAFLDIVGTVPQSTENPGQQVLLQLVDGTLSSRELVTRRKSRRLLTSR